MAKINIGAYIAAKRKEKGLTQEALANYLGVSKPAVSKWESGQSYPDIMLLPVIASYFNTSVDALLGYEAQLSKTDIRKLYEKLSAAFVSEPFDTVYEECRENVRKYHYCWGLIFSIAQLFINHCMLAGSQERTTAILLEASTLLERIETESCDAKLAKNALSLRVYCSLAMGNAIDVIDMLDNNAEEQLSTEILLAKAYIVLGETDKANEILQLFIYRNGVSIFSAIPDLMSLYAANTQKLDACLTLANKIAEAFELRKTLPHHFFNLYLTAAALYAATGNITSALNMLEAYTDLATDSTIFPLRLSGNSFFDRIEQTFDTKTLGNNAPRDERLIKKDIRNVVINNPAYSCLFQEERYQKLILRLEHLT